MLVPIVPGPVLEVLILPTLLALSLALGRALAGPLTRTPTHSRLERLLIYWLVGVVAFSWVGTILAALGLFKWWLVLGVLLALAILAGWRGRHGASAASDPDIRLQSTPWPVLIALVLALGGAGWLFARPAESFLLTDDSAVYTIGGIALSRSGSLFFQPDATLVAADDALSASPWDPAAVRSDSLWTPHTDFIRQFFDISRLAILTRHLGPFYQWRIDGGVLEIGFLPLPKVWAALTVWLFGPRYAPWAAPFFGLTGLAALYAFTRRLLNWQAGLMAMILLAVSLPQVWFARFPISEIYTQAILLAGLYLAVLARHNAERLPLAQQIGLWSGLSLAALMVVRFEALVYLLPLVVLLVLGWGGGSWDRDSFKSAWAVTLAGAGISGLLLSLGVSRYYLFSATLIPLTPGVTRIAVATFFLLAGCAGLLWRYWPQCARRAASVLAYARKWSSAAIAIGWVLWGLAALWYLMTRLWGSSLAGWLVQYWTRPGVALGVIGAVVLLWPDRRRAERPELPAFLGLAMCFLLLYSVNPLVSSVHPWAMRRTVPVIIPALALGCAGMLTEGLGRIRLSLLPNLLRAASRWIVPLGAILVFLVQAFNIGQRTYPLLAHQERKGLWQQLERLAGNFPQDAVLLFDNGEAGTRLTQVMELVFGHPSFVLWDTEAIRSDSRAVDRLISTAMARGRPVYLVITDGDLEWRSTSWRLVGHKAQRIDTPTLRYVWGRPPNASDLAQHSFWADSYQVLPTAEEGLSSAPEERMVEVPLGPGSYPYLRQGFYPFEFVDSNTVFRWTRGEALVTIPWPAATLDERADFCLELVVSGGRAPEAEAARLVVEAEGEELFREPLDKAFEQRTLRLPVRALANRGSPQLEIRLASSTWRPAEYSNPHDQRTLGVMVYSVRLLPPEQCMGGDHS